MLGPGVPEDSAGLLPYRYGFGADAADRTRTDLPRPTTEFPQGGGKATSAWSTSPLGSPYYNLHRDPAGAVSAIGRLPAPEDPLIGVMRHSFTVRDLKRAFPGLASTGQRLHLPLQGVPAQRGAGHWCEGWVDMVGLGRMVLSYPELPADVLAGRPMQRKAPVPHLQRLHHRAAQCDGVGLLPASTPTQEVAADGGLRTQVKGGQSRLIESIPLHHPCATFPATTTAWRSTAPPCAASGASTASSTSARRGIRAAVAVARAGGRDRDREGGGAVARALDMRLSGYCRVGFSLAWMRHMPRGAGRNFRAIDEAKTLGAPCAIVVVGACRAGWRARALGHRARRARRGRGRPGETLDYAKSVGMPLAIEPLHPDAGGRACLRQHPGARASTCATSSTTSAAGLGVAVDVYHLVGPRSKRQI